MRFLSVTVAMVICALCLSALLPLRDAQADHEGGVPKVVERAAYYDATQAAPTAATVVSASNKIHVSAAALYTEPTIFRDSCWQSIAWTIDTSTTVALPVELQWSRDGSTFQSFRTTKSWTVTADETLALQRLSIPVCPYVRLKLGPEPSSHVCTVSAIYFYRY